MTKHTPQLLTLGEIINLMEPRHGSHSPQRWYEIMDIEIPGMEEAQAAAAAADEDTDIHDPASVARCQAALERVDAVEADYIREHEADKYVISWPEHVIGTPYNSDANYRPAALDDEIEACDDLRDLRAILADAAANRPDEYKDLKTDNLNTFGGEDIQDTTGVFSWDEEHILIQAEDGWKIIPRCPECGEAPFHCHHDQD